MDIKPSTPWQMRCYLNSCHSVYGNCLHSSIA